jgi:MYXO-CTERM domain-containing protein
MKNRPFAAAAISLTLSLCAPAAFAVTIASSSDSNPYSGVRIVEGRTTGPATDFYAAYISLCTDYVHVDASSYNGARTARSYGLNAGAKLAVNGDFYTYSDGAHIYGDAVGGGQRWPSIRTGRDSAYSSDWYYKRYGWIAFGDGWVNFSNSERVKNQRADLGATEGWKPDTVTTSIPSETKALVSGFPQLVVEGAPVECSSPTASSCFPDRGDMRQRHPRTAMGLSRDRQTFILVVVDGRSSSSAGMYGTELAELMSELGAHTAFNLDGGGSSQMWARGQGTINNSSDGSPRGVFNHWGIFADSGHGRGRLASSCDYSDEGLSHQPAGTLRPATTDVDGDGRADACMRTPEGVRCHLSESDSFSSSRPVLGLKDDSGWGDLSNYATIRMGDVDGDGLADVCARANAQVICWRYDGQRFEELARGPQWSDASGFAAPQYFTTMRLADVTGDGRDDVCIRTKNRFICEPFDGDGFGPQIDGPQFDDARKWDRPDRYGTIRMADVNGDARMDVCARTKNDFRCWTSTGDGFQSGYGGPDWADDSGWRNHRYWSTIRMGDLDGDGRDDVCARTKNGVRCHLAGAASFGAGFDGPGLADGSGWDDPSNYMTMRLADVTGDGKMDLCARANAGMRCWPYEDKSFGSAFSGPLQDSSGWSRERFYRTIQFADIDADGKADLCARSSQALVCWRSTGDGFDSTIIEGPAWSDDRNFDQPSYYSTLRMVGPIGPVAEEPEEPGEDAGTADAVGGADTFDESDALSEGDVDTTTPSDTGGDLGTDALSGSTSSPVSTEACACRTGGGAPTSGLGLWLGALGVVVWRRKRP